MNGMAGGNLAIHHVIPLIVALGCESEAQVLRVIAMLSHKMILLTGKGRQTTPSFFIISEA